MLGQQGSKGPPPPAKLTAHQMQIVKALIAAHSDDIEVRHVGSVVVRFTRVFMFVTLWSLVCIQQFGLSGCGPSGSLDDHQFTVVF